MQPACATILLRGKKSAAIAAMTGVAQPQPHEVAAHCRLLVIGKRSAAVPDLTVVYVLDLARLQAMLRDQLGARKYLIERRDRRRRFGIHPLAAHGAGILYLIGC